MIERSDETPLPDAQAPARPAATDTDTMADRGRATGTVATPATRPRGSGLAGLALLVALAGALAGGYAAWRVLLIERGENNLRADLQQRLDALDTRLAENERRSARNNELAATLRDGLAENDRLRERLRADLLALSDRSARAESMLGDIAREQRGARGQLRTADAALAVAQADLRLRLFDDRAGALAALSVAEAALAGSDPALEALRVEVAGARAALAADPRPGTAALLGELDDIVLAIETLPLRAPARPAAPVAARGWWQRQFQRLDHLVTVRRLDDDGTAHAPTREAVQRALARARFAAVERDRAELVRALTAARASLAACCEGEATNAARATLDRLIALDWAAPAPDLQPLRQRLDAASVAPSLPSATATVPAATSPTLPSSSPTPSGDTLLSDREDTTDAGRGAEEDTP